MMNVTFRCPMCEATERVALDDAAARMVCPGCHHEPRAAATAIVKGELKHCPVCGDDELFIRKDFPQKLGVAIVVLGFILSSIAWYQYMIWLAFGILFATALIDVVLYLVMGEALVCYRCNAHVRDLSDISGYRGFDLETHERHRQRAARLQETRQTVAGD